MIDESDYLNLNGVERFESGRNSYGLFLHIMYLYLSFGARADEHHGHDMSWDLGVCWPIVAR